jgi:hypothetical protein
MFDCDSNLWPGSLWWIICTFTFVMTRRLIQCALLALIFSSLALAEHPELSGTWQLDVAASSFGAMPSPQSGVLAISTGPHKIFHMATFFQSPDKERTIETDWKIDNRYHPVEGAASGEVLAKWDGSMLIGRRLTEGGIEETRFRLGPGGDSLTETIQSGTNVSTLTWRRR